jgi:hypothetical protein
MEEQVENKAHLVGFKCFAGDNDVACILQFIDYNIHTHDGNINHYSNFNRCYHYAP